MAAGSVGHSAAGGEMVLLLAAGWPRRRVQLLLSLEGLGVVLVGSLIGVVVGVGYANAARAFDMVGWGNLRAVFGIPSDDTQFAHRLCQWCSHDPNDHLFEPAALAVRFPYAAC